MYHEDHFPCSWAVDSITSPQVTLVSNFHLGFCGYKSSFISKNTPTPFSHLWHRKAFWQTLASLSILCIDSSSQQPISSQCTPLQKPRWSQFPVERTKMVELTMWPDLYMAYRFTADKMIRTRMYKALSELFLNSLMVAKTDSMRQEKTKRKLEERKTYINTFIFCHRLSKPV